MSATRRLLHRRSSMSALIVGVLASVLLIASPAHAVVGTGLAVADGPVPWVTTGGCTGQAAVTDAKALTDQAATTNGPTLIVVVEGVATSQGPALDTGIICHLYQGGIRKGSVGGTGIGPAAVAAGTISGLAIAPYTFCAEVSSVYLTGSARNTCP